MIIVSGASSGLGRYLCRRFNAQPFNRNAPAVAGPCDVLIHCAFNAQRHVGISDVFRYFDDNTLLTQRLTSLRPRKFVYLSTVDVYPRNGQPHSEDEDIFLGQQDTAYGITKFLSEAVVRDAAANHLILRPTGMIGDHIRSTTLTRILLEARPTLTLAPETILNFVPHTDVGDFIDKALKQDITGTYNIAAASNATLADIARALGAEADYGSYAYDIGRIDIAAARAILPGLNRGTLENVTAFAADVRGGRITLA